MQYIYKNKMSNWKSCIPANPKFEGAKNSFCIVNVSIMPHESVSCKIQVQYQEGQLCTEFVNICGDEYKEWGADDNWIYEKIASKLALGTLCNQ